MQRARSARRSGSDKGFNRLHSTCTPPRTEVARGTRREMDLTTDRSSGRQPKPPRLADPRVRRVGELGGRRPDTPARQVDWARRDALRAGSGDPPSAIPARRTAYNTTARTPTGGSLDSATRDGRCSNCMAIDCSWADNLQLVQGEEIPSHHPVLSRGRECCASIVQPPKGSDCPRGDRRTVSPATFGSAILLSWVQPRIRGRPGTSLLAMPRAALTAAGCGARRSAWGG